MGTSSVHANHEVQLMALSSRRRRVLVSRRRHPRLARATRGHEVGGVVAQTDDAAR
jgi:hypothetical protein